MDHNFVKGGLKVIDYIVLNLLNTGAVTVMVPYLIWGILY